MSEEIKVSIIGLDTSHTVEFAKLLQSPDCPSDQRVNGMKVTGCLRFSTPFQSEEGLDQRQRQLEGWGIPVTLDFDEAAADCDAIMLEINDPAFHLEYFAKCSDLGKPIFIDKPLADNIENGRTMHRLAGDRGLRVMSASPPRFARQLKESCRALPGPAFVSTYGPLGEAAAGSSIVWYGVHAFEMLHRSTKQLKTKILSNRSLGDVKTGAFAVLRVDSVLGGDVSALFDKPILWTGFPTKNAHQGPIFSLCRGFLFFLWTFAFKSKDS